MSERVTTRAYALELQRHLGIDLRSSSLVHVTSCERHSFDLSVRAYVNINESVALGAECILHAHELLPSPCRHKLLHFFLVPVAFASLPFALSRSRMALM